MPGKPDIGRWVLTAIFFTACSCRVCGQHTEAPQIIGVEPSSAVTTPGARVNVIGAHFSPDSLVYFGGLQARRITIVNASTLQAETPYLRPGSYRLDLKSSETVLHSDVEFTALPAPVDSFIDQAEEMARSKRTSEAINTFENIASTYSDYDVRAYAHYRAGQLHLALGNYMEAGVQCGLMWDAKVSMGVQTSWRYRLLFNQTTYSISESNDHDTDLRTANASVEMDVTQNPELRFWRALVSARFGKMEQAKTDLRFILAAEHTNPSYRALAAYIGVLAGDKTQLSIFRNDHVNDARALALLGQAAWLSGDFDAARKWWKKIGSSAVALDCGAGQKHVTYGQRRIGTALLEECAAVAPDSAEGKSAKRLLEQLQSQGPGEQ